jgi:hypothetical protein
VGFAQVGAAGFVAELDRAQDHEKRILVALELGPLMAVQRVLDRQIVESELILNGAQQPFRRLDQPDPDEGLRPPQRVLDVAEIDLAQPGAAFVSDAVDDAGASRVVFTSGHRRLG